MYCNLVGERLGVFVMNELWPRRYVVELRRNESGQSSCKEINIRSKRSVGYQKERTVTLECIWPVGGPVVCGAMGAALENVLGCRN